MQVELVRESSLCNVFFFPSGEMSTSSAFKCFHHISPTITFVYILPLAHLATFPGHILRWSKYLFAFGQRTDLISQSSLIHAGFPVKMVILDCSTETHAETVLYKTCWFRGETLWERGRGSFEALSPISTHSQLVQGLPDSPWRCLGVMFHKAGMIGPSACYCLLSSQLAIFPPLTIGLSQASHGVKVGTTPNLTPSGMSLFAVADWWQLKSSCFGPGAQLTWPQWDWLQASQSSPGIKAWITGDRPLLVTS